MQNRMICIDSRKHIVTLSKTNIRQETARLGAPLAVRNEPSLKQRANTRLIETRVTGIRRCGSRWAQSRVICARSQALRGLGLHPLVGAGDD
jgi:hypothetical protein